MEHVTEDLRYAWVEREEKKERFPARSDCQLLFPECHMGGARARSSSAL